MEQRSAIGSHHTATTDVAWDAGAAERNCPAEPGPLRALSAWVDPQGDPASKGSYKFPHHMVSGGRVGAANLLACSSGIAILNGGRGGADIPPGDRRGIYNHLAAHLRDGQRQPPELNAVIIDAEHHDDGGFGFGEEARHEEMTSMNNELERRITMVPVELRAGAGRSIGGYAAVFNKLSGNLGGFVERVAPTFFNKMRSEAWPGVMCRWNHDNNMLLGTTEGRTLRLSMDDTGLFYEVDPPASLPLVTELVARGDVRKSSFAFFAPPDGQVWALSEQGYPQRTLHHDGVLVDVAPVNTPTAAYPDSSVALRSLAAQMGATFEEVRAVADANELRKFFVKTEAGRPVPKPQPKRLFAPAALLDLDARRSDPSEDQ